MTSEEDDESYTRFFRETEPKLRRALIAAVGGEAGREAAAVALEYAWEHWERIRAMDNPAGYVYRVGRSRGGKLAASNKRCFPAPLAASDRIPWVEPKLSNALERLTEKQRTAVMLVHGLDWTLTEVADLLSISPGSVNKHAQRGLTKLRTALEVEVNA